VANSLHPAHSGGKKNADNMKPITSITMEWLGSQVSNGEYAVFGDQAGFPPGIARCRPESHNRTVLLGTCYTGQATENSSEFMPAPGTVMYFQKTTRLCCHNGSPHQNADTSVYWTAANGNFYRANAGTSPDHYLCLVTGSNCLAIASWLSSGSAEAGTLEEAGLNISVRISCDGPRSDY
jgi:hypothetical protein